MHHRSSAGGPDVTDRARMPEGSGLWLDRWYTLHKALLRYRPFATAALMEGTLSEKPKPEQNPLGLRNRAEKVLTVSPAPDIDIETLSIQDIAALLHELRVNQIELEAQNEELRRVQMELETSRDRYSNLYDFSPVGFFTITPRGMIQEVNLTGSVMLDMPRTVLSGRPISRFILKADVDKFYLFLNDILETKKDSACELRLRRENGSEFEARFHGMVVDEINGTRTYRIAVTDITEQKTSERSLVFVEARYRTLFDTVRDGITVFRPMDGGQDFVVSDINGAAAEMWNTGRDGAIERSAAAVLPTVNEHSLVDVLERVWRSEEAEAFHVSMSEDGRPEKWLDCNVYRLPSGELVVISRDVTHRKKAEEDTLRRSEERFRAVFEGVTDCIFIEDSDLHYTHANPAAMNLLGLSESEIVGRTAEDLFGEETGTQISNIHSRVLSGQTVEYQLARTIHETTVTFSEIAVPLRDSEANIIGVCCVCRNITERGKLVSEPLVSVDDYPSRAMRETLKMARAASATSGIVFLQGESGSGKDYLARWIHDHSRRSNGPFFSINCATLPEHLAESELFGHERGAFTGAAVQKRGLLELAEGGTILLNEIGELPLNLQSKLLMFLDSNSFMRVGGQKQIRVDARLIAATHRDLNEELAHGGFLKPLYYRLSVFPIHVPPLRERIEDLPILVKEIMSQLAFDMQMDSIPVIDANQIAALSKYSWPGNVRELRNVIERSLILWRGGQFPVILPQKTADEADWSYTVHHVEGKTLRDVTTEVMGSLCGEVLRRCHGNKTETAKRLDISRDALYRYLRKFGVEL